MENTPRIVLGTSIRARRTLLRVWTIATLWLAILPGMEANGCHRMLLLDSDIRITWLRASDYAGIATSAGAGVEDEYEHMVAKWCISGVSGQLQINRASDWIVPLYAPAIGRVVLVGFSCVSTVDVRGEEERVLWADEDVLLVRASGRIVLSGSQLAVGGTLRHRESGEDVIVLMSLDATRPMSEVIHLGTGVEDYIIAEDRVYLWRNKAVEVLLFAADERAARRSESQPGGDGNGSFDKSSVKFIGVGESGPILWSYKSSCIWTSRATIHLRGEEVPVIAGEADGRLWIVKQRSGLLGVSYDCTEETRISTGEWKAFGRGTNDWSIWVTTDDGVVVRCIAGNCSVDRIANITGD